jgi:hypothetical protein
MVELDTNRSVMEEEKKSYKSGEEVPVESRSLMVLRRVG